MVSVSFHQCKGQTLRLHENSSFLHENSTKFNDAAAETHISANLLVWLSVCAQVVHRVLKKESVTMEVEELKREEDEGVDLLEFNEVNIMNPVSPWFHVIFDDDEEEEKLLNAKMINKPGPVGRENARCGSRRPYTLHHLSAIYDRVTVLPCLPVFTCTMIFCRPITVENET